MSSGPLTQKYARRSKAYHTMSRRNLTVVWRGRPAAARRPTAADVRRRGPRRGLTGETTAARLENAGFGAAKLSRAIVWYSGPAKGQPRKKKRWLELI